MEDIRSSQKAIAIVSVAEKKFPWVFLLKFVLTAAGESMRESQLWQNVTSMISGV